MQRTLSLQNPQNSLATDTSSSSGSASVSVSGSGSASASGRNSLSGMQSPSNHNSPTRSSASSAASPTAAASFSTGTKLKKGMYKVVDTRIGLPVIPIGTIRQSQKVFLETTSPIKLGMRNFWMKTLEDFTPKV